ncbi:MAG: hypothetical protein LAN83_01930 [Acidobacteriia bacterium]|nr:hypothetical protein [Terriglobia bacterium]
MTEKKKREKVVAEITLAHLIQLALENGHSLNQEEAIAFLNQEGRAYAMWKHMMQAGEDYIKSSLERSSRDPVPIRYAANGRRIAM